MLLTTSKVARTQLVVPSEKPVATDDVPETSDPRVPLGDVTSARVPSVLTLKKKERVDDVAIFPTNAMLALGVQSVSATLT